MKKFLLSLLATSQIFASSIIVSGGGGSGGSVTINGTTDTTYTFTTGTTGTDFATNTAGNVITYNLPDAGASARGAVTTGTQTLAGAKSFSSDLTAGASLIVTGNISSIKGVSYTYPEAQGASNTIMTNNGSGLLRWANLTTGTTGSDFAISSTANTHTFNIPDAGSSARGLVTTGTQTLAGAKTFSSNLTLGASVSIAGNISSIKGVTTTWPEANASGVLTNNGSGLLTWAAAASSGANTTLSNLTATTALNQDINLNAGKALKLTSTNSASDTITMTTSAGGTYMYFNTAGNLHNFGFNSSSSIGLILFPNGQEVDITGNTDGSFTIQGYVATKPATFTGFNSVRLPNIAASVGTAAAGMITFDTNSTVCGTNHFCGYDGTAWKQLDN